MNATLEYPGNRMTNNEANNNTWNPQVNLKPQNQNISNSLQFNNVLEQNAQIKPSTITQENTTMSQNLPSDINRQALLAMQSLRAPQPPMAVPSYAEMPEPQPQPMEPPSMQLPTGLPIAPRPEAAFAQPQPGYAPQAPVQIVRRNLTVAEMIGLLLASTLLLGGIQMVWNLAPKPIINIEWRR
jgi:hypothetical protein